MFIKQKDETLFNSIICNLQNYLVHIISYHIVNILLLVKVITELGVGNGDGAILTVSLNLKLIKLS